MLHKDEALLRVTTLFRPRLTTPASGTDIAIILIANILLGAVMGAPSAACAFRRASPGWLSPKILRAFHHPAALCGRSSGATFSHHRIWRYFIITQTYLSILYFVTLPSK